ncbi:beta-lactamase family protein [Streptomyces pactum]|uniref:Beta-lactamase family protein n=1 Tax=Streptomyces pactum TaxID=68249 RepID=A0ABS0NLL7_9ACTN|nr:serine hydrolase domain-containing protein [Streptomyces pactum]MBH5336084.1 beta-lactamase family protein [Streptomyces pactum]
MSAPVPTPPSAPARATARTTRRPRGGRRTVAWSVVAVTTALTAAALTVPSAASTDRAATGTRATTGTGTVTATGTITASGTTAGTASGPTAGTATASGTTTVSRSGVGGTAAGRPDAVEQHLSALVRQGAVPAALATTTDRHGRTRHYTAGTADLTTGAPVPVDGRVRIGSNTKAFTAVVVLQLVGEGKVGLDAPVDTYLPGLLRGEGIDGRRITVRHLLQHTSGLPEYVDQAAVLAQPRRYREPRDLLDDALTRPGAFRPGAKWGYSNTNYLVAGLIVQQVTGRPLGEEITRRVVRRAGLRHTSFPAPGDMGIPGPHPRGYHRAEPDGRWRDYTRLDPTWAGAAGAMISTNSDLNRFYAALLGGRLLAPAQLAQMRTTVPADEVGAGTRYGLGLVSKPLSCGGVYWGHGGAIPGYHTQGGVTDDGRAASVAVTAIPDDRAGQRMADAVDTALCR